MNKKNHMKILGVMLLVITAVSVALTFLIVSNMSHSKKKQSSEKKVVENTLTGVLSNAYIVSNSPGRMIILYDGKNYIAEETAESDYTGVADIEFSHGKIVKIYAKKSGIQGTLDSYSGSDVQIEGFEPLKYEGELPVYIVENTKVTSGSAVYEGKVSDLLVGNSKVELIMARGKASAIVCHKNKRVDKIRVLLKNGSSLFYPELYVKSSCSCRAGKNTFKAGTVISAESCMKKSKKNKTLRIQTTGEGMLYLCDRNGKKKTFGYEGSFVIRKVRGSYVLINELSVEDYVRYVLPSEMPPSFSYEALKAQAVCARTFAYGQMKNNAYAQYGANLDGTTVYQVYHASKPSKETDRAVKDTEGLVLSYQGKLIDCYYYSTSSGYSENLEVWDAKSPGYLTLENHTKEKTKDLSNRKAFHKYITKSAASYDDASPFYRWRAVLSGKLGMDEKLGRLKGLEVKKRSSSGYILSLSVQFEKGERIYEKENDIRYALGRYLLQVELSDQTVRRDLHSVPSACFEVSSGKNGTIVLTGGGFGHDIGMSQYGADAMAREGKNWQEILNYYYKGVSISDGSSL